MGSPKNHEVKGRPRLAVVIPTLNEELELPATLPRALAAGDEVCVSDGGSSDATVDIARSLGARVITGPAGRGGQLNRGAYATESDILLFLHADTRLPDNAGGMVRDAVAGGAVGGGFRIRYDPEPGLLRYGLRLSTMRNRLTGCPPGDQAQFVRREAFAAVGGFPEWPILEDIDFIRRLKRFGRLTIIDQPVITSARRFLKQGTVRICVTNYLIWALYLAGVPPRKLARLYRDIR